MICMEDVWYLKHCNNSSFFFINTIQQHYVAMVHCILPLLRLSHFPILLSLLLCLLRFFLILLQNLSCLLWMISHPFLTPHVSNPCNIVDSQIILYTGCPRRKGQNFGRVFLMLKYTDITQNTYIQSWTVTEIMAREKCGLLAGPRTVPVSCQVLSMFVLESGVLLRKVRSH